MIEPDELMCREHWKKVSVQTMADLVTATDPKLIEKFTIYAQLEVAAAEGLLHIPLPPDASRASNQPPVSPSAGGIEGTS